MRVLLAFDKFKDSMTAPEVCRLAADAIRETHPEVAIDSCPLADGGEGFVDILTSSVSGAFKALQVCGPRGSPTNARFGLVSSSAVPSGVHRFFGPDGIPAEVAVVEMASASGLALLRPEERDVWQTSTTGTGEVLQAAIRSGVGAVILGVGGSATHDLGLGALRVLGLRYHTAAGEDVPVPIPARWPAIARIAGKVHSFPRVLIACDVTNPLLGRNGAATIYGPQKGLQPNDVRRLDHESARLALLLCGHFERPDSLMEKPGAGAAGGIAFGLMTATNATIVPGFDFVSAWLDLDARISAADIVVTGEGRFDESSFSGKGPGAVATRALAAGKSVHIFAGAVGESKLQANLHVHTITPPGTVLAQALREGRANLRTAVHRVFSSRH